MKSISKGFVSKHLRKFSVEDNTSLFEFSNFDDTEFQQINRALISELVLELFNHINSKESFNYISNLLISSLKEYEKYFTYNINSDNAKEGEKIEYKNINLLKPINDSRNEYLGILKDIDAVLSNCSEMTHIQRIDFCNSQRHFMKLYLKQVVTENNIA